VLGEPSTGTRVGVVGPIRRIDQGEAESLVRPGEVETRLNHLRIRDVGEERRPPLPRWPFEFTPEHGHVGDHAVDIEEYDSVVAGTLPRVLPSVRLPAMSVSPCLRWSRGTANQSAMQRRRSHAECCASAVTETPAPFTLRAIAFRWLLAVGGRPPLRPCSRIPAVGSALAVRRRSWPQWQWWGAHLNRLRSTRLFRRTASSRTRAMTIWCAS